MFNLNPSPMTPDLTVLKYLTEMGFNKVAPDMMIRSPVRVDLKGDHYNIWIEHRIQERVDFETIKSIVESVEFRQKIKK